MAERSEYSTVIIDEKLYAWGGNTPDMHLVHDSDKKRNITSFVEVFDILSLSLSKVPTVGIPPPATMGYSCASINDTVYYFGGDCMPANCYHNNVFALNTVSNEWNQVYYANTENVPMEKFGHGMISFSSDKGDYLLTIGGVGPSPATIPSHSMYTPSPTRPNRMYTNETHILCVSALPGYMYILHD